MSSQQTDIRQVLRSQLLDGCGKVPVKQYQSWDVERVRAFKVAIVSYRKLANNPRATEVELHSAINQLGTFWS